MFRGWTFCFGIIVPPLVTAHPIREKIKYDKSILVVPPSTQDQKAVFQLLLSFAEATERDLLNLHHQKEITILGRIRMPREQVWLTLFYDDYSAEDRAIVADYFRKLTINLGAGSKIEAMRARYLHVVETGGTHPHLVDIQLGRENAAIEGQP